MKEKIFSGENSKSFWEAVNRAANRASGKNKNILYDYGCKAQEIEQQRDDLLEACKGLMEKADNGSADFDDPPPGSIYLIAKAAIAKCEA